MVASPDSDPSHRTSIQMTPTPDEERKFAELAQARGKGPASHAREVVTA